MRYFHNINFDDIYQPPTPEKVATVFFNRMYLKLHKLNFSILITLYGKHRTGKSLFATMMGYLLDPTFEPNMPTRVVYDGKSIMNAFNDLNDNNIKGGCVIIDEAGSTELSHLRWFEEAAKIVNSELQASGHLNPLVIFVTQSFSFINTVARKLSQGVFEVTRTHNEYSVIKPYWIENNPWTTGTYRKFPIICERYGDIVGNIYKANKLRVPMPPPNIVKRYEKISLAFKQNLLKSSIQDIESLELMKQQRNSFTSGIEEMVNEIMDDVNKFIIKKKNGNDRINDGLIKHHFDVSWKDARLIMNLVNQKLENNTNNKSN